MKKCKAVFLDRDGTINHDYGYISDPNNFDLIHGVRAALRLLLEVDFKIFVVSNQSGVARGLFDEKQLKIIEKKMIDELLKGDVRLSGIKYCIHHPDDGCKCRKPSPIMVKELAKEYNVDLTHSYFIGDKILDVKTGYAAKCKTVLLLKEDDVISEEFEEWSSPDFVAENICHAVEWILKDSGSLKALKDAIMKGL